MANAKSEFHKSDFTGLANECFTIFISTYEPARIIAMCKRVQELEWERDNLKALVEMAMKEKENSDE